jgi:hypothetical protein
MTTKSDIDTVRYAMGVLYDSDVYNGKAHEALARIAAALQGDEKVVEIVRLKNLLRYRDGYVMVPREPTEKMQDSIWLAAQLQNANAQYRAMVKAAEKENE